MSASDVFNRRRSTTALIVALALLFLVIAATAFIAVREDEAQGWVQRSLIIENNLGRIRSLLQAAEDNERGYLLTGDRGYFSAAQDAGTDLSQLLITLATSVSGDAQQAVAAEKLRSLVAGRLQLIRQSTNLSESGKSSDALALARTNQGQVMMAQALTTIDGIMDTERNLLVGREADLERINYAVLGGMATALILLAILGLLVVREMRHRIASLVEAYGALKLANTKLAEEISERERVESQLRQAQKMETLGQLTGGIAHDFNNMLAVILSSLGLLRRRLQNKDYDVARFVDGATEAADKAAALTHRLLAFGRQQPLTPQPLDANKLVSNISNILRGTLGAIELEVIRSAGLWLINADSNQLENVLLNLAVNARDAMPDGGKLTIETANASLDEDYASRHVEVAPGQYVLIAVTDNGCGMPPDVIARAFDPFFTTKGIGKGTGLGLSQVFGFVKQSGGHVKIYSEVGVGTAIKIYLPRCFADAREAPSVHDARPERATAANQRHSILVVEDEASMREVSVEALRELGYDVLHADGARAALVVLDSHPDVTLLFTDVVMPDMNGRALAEEVQRRSPKIKILYTTGFSRNAIIHNNVLDPDVNFIAKPFSIEQLARKIRDVLSDEILAEQKSGA